MKLKARPRYLFVEASTYCQLSCPVCPNGRGTLDDFDIKRGHLRPSDFSELLDTNPGIAGVELSNWGEPFMNPNIVELLQYALARNVRLVINSNLGLRKKGFMKALVDNKVRKVVCSIDGASQETYKIYRVGGNFNAVIENAAEVNELKREFGSEYPRMIWKFIVFAHNEHEITKAKQMAQELGMEFQLALPIEMDLSVGKDIECTFSPANDKDRLRSELGFAAMTECEKVIGYDPMPSTCMQLWDQPVVNWNGDILGCCSSQKKTGGNAFAEGLTKAINNADIRYARAMVLGLKPPREDIGCTDCYVYKEMARSGRWLKPKPLDKLVRSCIDHFGIPPIDRSWSIRAYFYIQGNVVPWSYLVIREKFS